MDYEGNCIDGMTQLRTIKPWCYGVGAFLRIRLPDGSFGYGRVLEPASIAFYSYRTLEPSTELDVIASKSVLFSLGVRAIGLDDWEYIGKADLVGEVAKPVTHFWQDIHDFRECNISDSIGNERRATPEECIGLERAAAWERHSIEERLLDRFIGRPNEAEQHLKVRLK